MELYARVKGVAVRESDSGIRLDVRLDVPADLAEIEFWGMAIGGYITATELRECGEKPHVDPGQAELELGADGDPAPGDAELDPSQDPEPGEAEPSGVAS